MISLAVVLSDRQAGQQEPHLRSIGVQVIRKGVDGQTKCLQSLNQEEDQATGEHQQNHQKVMSRASRLHH